MFWLRWFAWYPVKVGRRDWAWFEWVEYYSYVPSLFGCAFIYRRSQGGPDVL